MPGARSTALSLIDALAGASTAGLMRLLRLLPRHGTANAAAAIARTVGPLFKEHRIGRANLKAAFPEKSDTDIEIILAGVWDNLGRVAAEFAHLDRIRLSEPGKPGDIDHSPEATALFEAIRTDGKPALVFSAHLGNWELPALIAHKFGIDSAVLYRRPNLGSIADAVERVRAGSMGQLIATSISAPVTIVEALRAGRHIGMLVDQYYVRGVDVTFFGQRTRANPLIARLARQIDCPIHGVRIVRVDSNRFHADLTPAITPARDADGQIDVAGTMQMITGVIEGWVREHPEQWLWLHRRWRPEDPPFNSRS